MGVLRGISPSKRILKRQYHFYGLAWRYGFGVRETEKVCRISDFLEDVSAVKFLLDHLSLYGGTALTFIYSEEILRLSVDLDLNYRHLDIKDWGEARKEIDERMKDLLYREGYARSNHSHKPKLPSIEKAGIDPSFLVPLSAILNQWIDRTVGLLR